jgi:4-hydroxy-tetrahydrodipicolinate synthase
MTLPRPLTGVIPPVCTPFTESNELDVPSLERLIGFLLDAGVSGLFMLGSTSETATLTDAQRKQVIEVAVRVAAGSVPVLAGVIDMGTARMIEHGLAAKALGADGLVATAPFYIRPSQGEIVTHYRALREAVDLPTFAYDIPQNVQVKLDRATIATLAAEGTIVGLKDSSGDDGNFRGVLLDTRQVDGFSVLTGSETTVDNALLMGAHGVVPGIGNVDPAGFVRIFTAIQAGDLEGARREQERLFNLFAITRQATGRIGHTASALGGFKTALVLRGVIATNVTGRPMTRLDDAETAGVRRVLEGAGLL